MIIPRAARLWAQGYDTYDIAKFLRVPEFTLVNKRQMTAIRAEARRIKKGKTYDPSHHRAPGAPVDGLHR
jgi:hypothetical protein